MVQPRLAQPSRRRRWRRIAIALLSLPAIAIAASAALAKSSRGHGKDALPGDGERRPSSTAGSLRRAAELERLQALAEAVRQKLGIDRAVTVAVVDVNPYLVSVEAPKSAAEAFVVSIEAQMLQLLTMDEIEAVLAHELGHVWIFTHHPYLQTELLANQVAMRAVTRDALARVYEKVWKHGPKGDLVAFLGNPGPQ